MYPENIRPEALKMLEELIPLIDYDDLPIKGEGLVPLIEKIIGIPVKVKTLNMSETCYGKCTFSGRHSFHPYFTIYVSDHTDGQTQNFTLTHELAHVIHTFEHIDDMGRRNVRREWMDYLSEKERQLEETIVDDIALHLLAPKNLFMTQMESTNSHKNPRLRLRDVIKKFNLPMIEGIGYFRQINGNRLLGEILQGYK